LLETALVRILDLIEARALGSELRLDRRGELLEALLLDVAPNLPLPGHQLRALILDRGHDAFVDELLVRLGLEPRAFVFRLRDGERRALIELLALQAQLHLGKLASGG